MPAAGLADWISVMNQYRERPPERTCFTIASNKITIVYIDGNPNRAKLQIVALGNLERRVWS